MKTRDQLALGLFATAGALWGTRAYLRSRRWIELRDRVVIVTGADSGLGLILCRQLAAHGAIVVMAARNREALDAAGEEIRRAGARGVLCVPTDVSVEAQAGELVDRAIQEFGKVDVLINNAGLMIVGAEPTLSKEDYLTLLDVNFWGAFHTSQAVLPSMRRNKFGRIANVSSVGGRFVVPHMAPYVASKFALTGYTKALRVEAVRDNVFVTGIYPATIRTGGHTHAWFKGDREAEYAWFAMSDALPGVATSAETAASHALRAIQAGDPEVVVGLSAKLAIAFEGLFPGWASELTSLIESTMPAPANLGEPAVQGQELRGKLAEFANRLVPARGRA